MCEIANPEEAPKIKIKVESDFDETEGNHMLVVTAPGHYTRAFGVDFGDLGYTWNRFQQDDDIFFKEVVAPKSTDVLAPEMERIRALFPTNPFTEVIKG